MPKFTEEQVERAKNVDVRTFLEQTEGYTFQQSGKYLKCSNPERTGQPSSLSIDTSLNRIYYNSVTGNRPLSAIDWCKEIRKMDFQSAMTLILGENPQGERTEKPKHEQYRSQSVPKEAKKEFTLPEKSETAKNVFMYLTQTRGISKHIVNSCLKHDLIYQDNRKNAVFVGKDDSGQPKYAARRGTITVEGVEPFKRDCSGSDKNFAFRLEGKNTDTIYVTEAAIDALSIATLEDKFNGDWSYKNKTYISTGGAGVDSAIEQFCKTHDVKTINICFDNDKAGQNGMEKIMQKYREQGYEVNDMRASLAHDYNDELLAYNKNPDFYTEPPMVVTGISIPQERNDNMPEVEITANAEHKLTEQEEKKASTENEIPINEVDIPPETPDYYIDDVPPEPYDHYIEEDILSENTGYASSIQPQEQTETAEITNTKSVVMPEKENTSSSQPIAEESFPDNVEKNAEPQQSVIFGNISYNKIPNKEYIDNVSSDISANLFTRLQEDKIAFSGKFTDNGMTVVVSKEDVDRVKSIINVEMEQLKSKQEQVHMEQTIPEQFEKTEQIDTEPANSMTEQQENKSADVSALSKQEVITEQEFSVMQTEEKMNLLLASLKERQENKRADLLDNIDDIISKIERHQNRIEKLNAKIDSLETSLKTAYAFKRAFGNTAIGQLIDNDIDRKKAKIVKIKETKIPKIEDKIRKQNVKKSKKNIKLGKVNRKIDNINKVQKFLDSVGSKDKDEFIDGLNGLSEIRQAMLEDKMKKITRKISNLTAEYNSPDISHRERLEIGKKINNLRVQSEKVKEKLQGMQKLQGDLSDIRNGKFTDEELDTAINKTADKLSEKLDSIDTSDENGLVNNIVAHSVESGSEAISEISAEKAMEQAEKAKPDLDRERTPEEREPETDKSTEQQILAAIAVVTGIDISELNRLPAEIKADIISEFQENNGNIPTAQLAERICDIADIELPETVKPVEISIHQSETNGKEKENPLKQLEDILEENDNHFDGMLNNLPTEKAKEKTIIKDEPLFSRSKIMSKDFDPTSSKSQEEIERDKNKKHSIGL